jgi:hypothetical protein
MSDCTKAEMYSPLLSLFALFWWLLVIGSVGGALFGASTIWESQAPHPHAWQQQVEAAAGAIKLGSSLLPFVVMTIIRRIATGRWRFGPRW